MLMRAQSILSKSTLSNLNFVKFLLFHTILGTKAYRDTKDGSWFVTALCTVLRDYANREHLLDMMLRVSKSKFCLHQKSSCRSVFDFHAHNLVLRDKKCDLESWSAILLATAQRCKRQGGVVIKHMLHIRFIGL